MLKLSMCDLTCMTQTETHAMLTQSGMKPEKAERLLGFPNRAATAVAGALVRRAIGQVLHIPAESVRLRADKNGKPYCENADIYISMSHSGPLAVCALSDTPVGIAAEQVRNIQMQWVKDVFTDAERRYIFSDPGIRNRRFIEIMTKKQAYVKRKGGSVDDWALVEVLRNRQVYLVRNDDYMVAVSKA